MNLKEDQVLIVDLGGNGGISGIYNRMEHGYIRQTHTEYKPGIFGAGFQSDYFIAAPLRRLSNKQDKKNIAHI